MCTILILNVAENKIRKKPYATLQDEGSMSMLSRSCEHIFQRLPRINQRLSPHLKDYNTTVCEAGFSIVTSYYYF